MYMTLICQMSSNLREIGEIGHELQVLDLTKNTLICLGNAVASINLK